MSFETPPVTSPPVTSPPPSLPTSTAVQAGARARRSRDKSAPPDVNATVQAVGAAVTRFRAGDEVFGIAAGAFAEYALAPQDKLARKPGFALQEAALPFEGPDSAADVAGPMLGSFPDKEYPHLVGLTTQHVLQPGYDFGQEFEFGLTLILDGLEARRSRAAKQVVGASLPD